LLVIGTDDTPQNICPSHIDYFDSAYDGIWYPDNLTLEMAWCGGNLPPDCKGSSYPFNPFKIDSSLCVFYFTEQLPKDCSVLQWALRQPELDDISDFRGNCIVAELDRRPKWLSKMGYLLFGNMRAFSYM